MESSKLRPFRTQVFQKLFVHTKDISNVSSDYVLKQKINPHWTKRSGHTKPTVVSQTRCGFANHSVYTRKSNIPQIYGYLRNRWIKKFVAHQKLWNWLIRMNALIRARHITTFSNIINCAVNRSALMKIMFIKISQDKFCSLIVRNST